MRRIIAAIFKRPLVWTQDHDGDVRLRLVRGLPFNPYAFGLVSSTRGFLEADGRITYGKYLRRWMPANERAEQLLTGNGRAA